MRQKQIYPQYSEEYSESGWLGQQREQERQRQPAGANHNQQQMGGQQATGGHQSMGGQQAGGGQPPMGGQQTTGGQDLLLEEVISDTMQIALQDFVEAVKVCEWCADRCIDEGPQMAECIRLCRDVADIATLNIQLLSRGSMIGPQAAELFISAAEACAQECAQHSHRHCQACAETLRQAIQTTQQMVSEVGAGQQMTY